MVHRRACRTTVKIKGLATETRRHREIVGSWQLAVGSWQLAVGSWQLAVGSRQSAVGSYCLLFTAYYSLCLCDSVATFFIMEKQYEIHLISHTHWDREWYRTFQQFRMKLVELVDSLLEILETDPDFKHFNFDGQTIVLEDYLEIKPQNEERLKKQIQDGRIAVGPWYILFDEFLVSVEATVRNLILGHRIAKEFRKMMNVDYIPDPFGHISQMPQILRGFGIDNIIL